MGNIVSKLGAETPSVGKIQEAMTSVVDYFRTLGYVPKKGSLERVPAVDEFVTQNNVPHSYLRNVTEHTYSIAEVPVQKYHSYKQWEGANWQWLNREDFDGGKCVRRIYTETDEMHPMRGIEEYEYNGDKLAKVTEYKDIDGKMFVKHKTIDTQTGDYCEEVVLSSGANVKKYYNANHQKIKEMDTREFGDTKYVSSKIYDPKTHKVTGIELEETLSTGTTYVYKCDINPETGKISKYLYQNTVTGKVCSSFEMDNAGNLTHYKHLDGTEYKYDAELGISTVTTPDGQVQSGKHIKTLFGNDFEKDAISRLPYEMKKYV